MPAISGRGLVEFESKRVASVVKSREIRAQIKLALVVDERFREVRNFATQAHATAGRGGKWSCRVAGKGTGPSPFGDAAAGMRIDVKERR